MNKILLILISLCLLFVSCDKENQVEYSSGSSDALCFYVSDQYTAPAPSSRGSVFDATPQEREIKDMIVFFYEKSDGDVGRYLGYNQVDVSGILNKGVLNGYELQQVDWNKMDFIPKANCDILVLVNCLDNGFVLNHIVDMAKESIHELQNRLKVGRDILKNPTSLVMSAHGSFSPKAGALVCLERCVAKVCINLSDDLIKQGYAIESLQWFNERDSAYVLKAGESFHPDKNVSEPCLLIQKQMALSYVYETFASSDTKLLAIVGLSSQGKTAYYRIEINDRNGRQSLNRNSLYRVGILTIKGYGATNPEDAVEFVASSQLGLNIDGWDSDIDHSLYFNANNGYGFTFSRFSIDRKIEDLPVMNAKDTILIYWKEATGGSIEKKDNLFGCSVKYGVALSAKSSSSWSEPDSLYVTYNTLNAALSTNIQFTYDNLSIKIPVEVQIIPPGVINVAGLLISPYPILDTSEEVVYVLARDEKPSDYSVDCPKGWRVPTWTEMEKVVPFLRYSKFDESAILLSEDGLTRIAFNHGRKQLPIPTQKPFMDPGFSYFIVSDDNTDTFRIMKLDFSSLPLVPVDISDKAGNNLHYPMRCVRPEQLAP